MAFRLFGIGSKRSSASSTAVAPTSSAGTASSTLPPEPNVSQTEDIFGFMVINSNGGSPPLLPPQQPAQSDQDSQRPYGPEGGSTTGSSTSKPKSYLQYLDGVPFVLENCGPDLDSLLARIEDAAERVQNVNWDSADYDFTLERTVVSQDMVATIRRAR